MATRRRTGSDALLPLSGVRVPIDDLSKMPVPSKPLLTHQGVRFAGGEEPIVRRRPPRHIDLARLRRVLSIDDVIRGVLFLLAVLTRFYRLGYPNKVVFDEYHFGKFTEAALMGHVCRSFVTLLPLLSLPLLLVAIVARLRLDLGAISFPNILRMKFCSLLSFVPLKKRE